MSLALAEKVGFLDFRLVEHIFELPRGKYGAGATFRCQLVVTPRVDEVVILPFVPVRYSSTYYVDSVQHEHHNEKTEITIELREGRYNSHLRQLRHWARFRQELWSMSYSADDSDLTKYFQEEEAAGKQAPAAPALSVSVVSTLQRGRRGKRGFF